MRRILAGLAIVAMVCGCGTFGELGITKEMAVTAAMYALENNELGGVAERDEVEDIAGMVGEIMTRETELSNKLDEIAQRKQAQDRIAWAMNRYFVDGEFVDPNIPAEEPWENIVWISENYAGAELEWTLKASISGGRVQFQYPEYDWPSKDEGASVDAVCCFFAWNGEAFEGGKFEWIRDGGQSSKSLKKIEDGYGGLSAPESGTRVAFAWVSVDGQKRSSLAETTWP